MPQKPRTRTFKGKLSPGIQYKGPVYPGVGPKFERQFVSRKTTKKDRSKFNPDGSSR